MSRAVSLVSLSLLRFGVFGFAASAAVEMVMRTFMVFTDPGMIVSVWRFLLVNRALVTLLFVPPVLLVLGFFLQKALASGAAPRWRRALLVVELVLALALALGPVFDPGEWPEWEQGAAQTGGVDAHLSGVENLRPPNVRYTMRELANRPAYRVALNNHGFRDDDWPPAPPEGVVSIFLVGDSYVFGSGIEQAERLSVQLQRALEALSPGRAVRVFNVAQEGWNLHQEVEAIVRLGELLRPSLVLVGHLAGNDLWPRDPIYNRALRWADFRELMPEIRSAQIAHYKDRELSFPELRAGYHEDLRRLARWARGGGSLVAFYEYGDCMAEVSDYVARGDFADLGQFHLDEPGLRIPGDGHPTAQGNRVLAARLAPQVHALLRVQAQPAAQRPGALRWLQPGWARECEAPAPAASGPEAPAGR